MAQYKSKPSYKAADIYPAPNLEMSPHREFFEDSGIGMHPHPPSNPATPPKHQRARERSRDSLSSRRPSLILFEDTRINRASSPRQKLITSNNQKEKRPKEGHIPNRARNGGPKVQVTTTKEFPTRNGPGKPKTKSINTKHTISLNSSISPSTSEGSNVTDDPDIDPFASRPKIPRGDDCTFSVSESPSNEWNSEPLAPINFSRQQRHGDQADQSDSSSSSEEFSYGAWGTSPPSAPASLSPTSKAIARKMAIEERVERNRVREVMARKHQHQAQKTPSMLRTKSGDTVLSFPSLVNDNNRNSTSPRTKKMNPHQNSASPSPFEEQENPFQRFSSTVSHDDRPIRRPTIRRVTGSFLSSHHEAYSPVPRTPLRQHHHPLPHPPMLESEDGDGARSVKTSFRVPRGSRWVVYIDGMKVAGSGDFDVEVEAAPRMQNEVEVSEQQISSISDVAMSEAQMTIDSSRTAFSNRPPVGKVKNEKMGFGRTAGNLFRRVLGRKKVD